jgi:hypothetical protein
MSIKFACSCGKAYKVPEKFAGKRVKCKQCDEPIRVPSESEGNVNSSRASAVSKRSLLQSQRVPAGSGTSGRSSTSSSKRLDAPKRVGSGTERFTAVDLNEGNALKVYQRRRDEDFKRGEGRVTYFQDGKPAKAFRLTKDDVTIGRGEGCTVALPVDSVSKEHVKIEYKLGTFIATDMQSQNGLVVNGKTVRRSSLEDGDILQLGEAILRVDCG